MYGVSVHDKRTSVYRKEAVLAKSSEKSSEKIITLIKRDPHIAASNIAEQLGLTSRAVEKQIAQLKVIGRLQRIGPAKGGYWKVLSVVENVV